MQMTEHVPRRRRDAFHAESNEEFIAKLKVSDLTNSFTTLPMSEITAYSPPDKIEEYITKRKSDRNALANSTGNRSGTRKASNEPESWNFIENEGNPFDTVKDSKEKVKSPRKSSDSYDKEAVLVSIKLMAIGETKEHIHAFIDYLFEGDKEPISPTKHPLDLRVQALEKEKEVLKYHFWMKGYSEDDMNEKLKPLYKIYYKRVSSLVFLYNVDKRESFLSISQNIKNISTELGLEQLKGILVGIKTGDSQALFELSETRQVTWDEGEQLRQETGLCEFFEVNLSNSSQRDVILNLLENLKKQGKFAESPKDLKI